MSLYFGAEVLPAPLADTDVDALCLSTSELDLKQKEGSQSRITESDNTNITFDNELFFEIECDICTELRPHTSFISTSGKSQKHGDTCTMNQNARLIHMSWRYAFVQVICKQVRGLR